MNNIRALVPKKHLNAGSFFCGLVILVFIFGFNLSFISAQDEATAGPVEASVAEEAVGGNSQVDVQQAEEGGSSSDEALQDDQVTFEDLGVKKASVLPDSPFYGLKKLWRKTSEVLTFNPLKKAKRQHQHAVQQLAEAKQLVEEKGIENVKSEVIINAVENFSKQLEKIKGNKEKLKDKKNGEAGEVEQLLNEMSDKQMKAQKVIEDIGEKIIEHKDGIKDAEQIFYTVNQQSDEALGSFAEVLTGVDDEDKIARRLEKVSQEQKGSNFKHLKSVEFLQKLEDKVGDNKKDFIKQAQTRMRRKFEEDIRELPPIVRAEKLKNYARNIRGDETRHLAFFEDLKQSGDVPKDVLQALDKIKEFTAQRFEQKLGGFELKENRDRFFEHLRHGSDIDDVMVLNDLKEKMGAQHEEVKKQIEEEYKKGLESFKKQFTDPKSQEQAERFRQLGEEMAQRPNPTTFRLIRELEEEVKNDPEKKAFMQEMENKTKAEFEKRFRKEGGEFMERITSLRPEDMQIMHEFKQEGSFDPGMIDQFFKSQIEKFQDYVQEINDPSQFHQFNDRFRFAPPEVIDLIKKERPDFGKMMQFKMRKMKERELDMKGEEARRGMEQEMGNKEDEWRKKLDRATNWEETQKILKEKKKWQEERAKKELKQEDLSDSDWQGDPFCNEACQQIQKQYFEKKLDDKAQELGSDGFGNLEELLKDKAKKFGDFRGDEFMDSFMAGPPMGTTGPSPCPLGQINIPKGPGQFECVDDPYFMPPEDFKDCPPGMFWNEKIASCKFDNSFFGPIPGPGPSAERPLPGGSQKSEKGDLISNGPFDPRDFCGPDEQWDETEGCVRRAGERQCAVGEYFDFFEKRCKKDDWKSCAKGEYLDLDKGGCVKDIFEDRSGEAKDFQQNIDQGDCLDNWEPICGEDGVTYSNACYLGKAGVKPKHNGECDAQVQPLPFEPVPFKEKVGSDGKNRRDGFERGKPEFEKERDSFDNRSSGPGDDFERHGEEMKHEFRHFEEPGQEAKEGMEGKENRQRMGEFRDFNGQGPQFFEEPTNGQSMPVPGPEPGFEPMPGPEPSVESEPLPSLPPLSETTPAPGEVLGAMSVREIDELINNPSLTFFNKMWQIGSVIFHKDRPLSLAMITVYIPHKVLRSNTELKPRILWTEGGDYYRLRVGPQGRVLGASTKREFSLPPTVIQMMWKIVSSLF